MVHVAGSKGKGSTALFTEAILRAAGERVGTFTSPHLERWSERFRIDGAECATHIGQCFHHLRGVLPATGDGALREPGQPANLILLAADKEQPPGLQDLASAGDQWHDAAYELQVYHTKRAEEEAKAE